RAQERVLVERLEEIVMAAAQLLGERAHGVLRETKGVPVRHGHDPFRSHYRDQVRRVGTGVPSQPGWAPRVAMTNRSASTEPNLVGVGRLAPSPRCFMPPARSTLGCAPRRAAVWPV